MSDAGGQWSRNGVPLSEDEGRKCTEAMQDWKMLNAPFGQPPKAPNNAIVSAAVGASPAHEPDTHDLWDALTQLIDGEAKASQSNQCSS